MEKGFSRENRLDSRLSLQRFLIEGEKVGWKKEESVLGSSEL